MHIIKNTNAPVKICINMHINSIQICIYMHIFYFNQISSSVFGSYSYIQTVEQL